MAQTTITTTTTTTTGTQTGSQLVVTTTSNTQSVGNFVTDVSIQPYIANRVVSFFAYNMRPNQRMHIFFDSVLVDQYCAPSVRDGSNNYNLSTISDTSDFTQIPRNGSWGTAVYSDSRGIVAGQFNIPGATFKTGDRVLQITDVDSLVYGNTAYTTLSSATFTASNLSVTKQAITLTTVNPDVSWVPVQNSYTTTTTNVVIKTAPDIVKTKFNITAWEPLAQALTITTPNNESGIYATALTLFFKQKAQTSEHGVTVYVCETNNGYPDGSSILPFSTVHKTWAEISVSDKATIGTKFVFESPVFLSNQKTYAFIVKPDANDPDYYVWTANLGDVDVNSGYQVYSQPIIGTAFYGSTTLEWTALQTEYVKFILHRADFLYGIGTAEFNNSNMDFLTVFNVGYSNTSVDILAGDVAYQSVNSFTNSSTSSCNTQITGTVNYYDPIKGILYVDSSTGKFTSNSYVQIHRFANSSVTVPTSLTLIAYANTGLLYNPGIDALVPQLAYISPPGTTLNFGYTGTSNTFAIDANENKVSPGYETEFFDYERVVVSRSTEVSNMSSNKSVAIKANLTTDSTFVSPAIDTVRNQQLAIKNDVDPVQFKYEEFFNSGNTKSKYVSKIVTLASGQDAEDIQIILTAYRPTTSDIQVWIKLLNGEDTDSISQKVWAPMYMDSPWLYSDPTNPEDMREFVFKLGSAYSMIRTAGTTTSANSSTTVTGVGTAFTTELKPGWFVNMRSSQQGGTTINEKTRKVVSITDDTHLVLDSPFIGNYSAQPLFIVPPPTTPWLSYGSKKQLTGTVTASPTTNIITGSGTFFDTELKAASIIYIDGDEQEVLSIANSTSLTVGTPWSASVSGANSYLITRPGITYLNENLNLYSTFKQFQIKIILQSNDSSKVPILDDLRVLAMQL